MHVFAKTLSGDGTVIIVGGNGARIGCLVQALPAVTSRPLTGMAAVRTNDSEKCSSRQRLEVGNRFHGPGRICHRCPLGDLRSGKSAWQRLLPRRSRGSVTCCCGDRRMRYMPGDGISPMSQIRLRVMIRSAPSRSGHCKKDGAPGCRRSSSAEYSLLACASFSNKQRFCHERSS